MLIQIHDKGLDSSWIGYMIGQVEFNTNVINNGILSLSDDCDKHVLLSGGML